MRKTIIIIVICIVLVTSWSLLFVIGKDKKPVSAEKVQLRDLEKKIELSGKVISKNVYTITSETGGLVESINFKQGDSINKNNTIISLSNNNLKNEYEKAKLSLSYLKDNTSEQVLNTNGFLNIEDSYMQKQNATIALAQSIGMDLELLNNTFNDKPDLNNSITNSTENINVLDNEIEIAQLSVNTLIEKIDSLQLKSSIDGEVISVNCNLGQYLSPFIPAVVIADVDDLIIEAIAFENDTNKINEYMPANIALSGLPTQTGYISDVGTLTSTISEYQTSDVVSKIEVTPESSKNLKLGSSADIEIVLDSRENVISIPVDAIENENTVFIIEKDKVHKKQIETGFTDGYYIEVKNGLDIEDVVIICPKDIADGDRVIIE